MNERERSVCLWVISDDMELYRQIEGAMAGHRCCTRDISCAQAADAAFWRKAEKLPGAVLLDVGDELDWAEGVLRDIKRAHVRVPVIALSGEPSKEFGMKIVSAGINYFLPRDFDARELRDVVTGLVRT